MFRSLKSGACLFTLISSSFAITACGHSEKEWQAQLDKYNHLASENQSEKDAHEKAQRELEETKTRVANLASELEKMGVNMDALSSQVQQTSTEKEQLAKNLEELQAALAEYKKRAESLEKIKASYDELRSKLKKLTDLGLKVEIRRNRMVIRLPGDVLYPSGSDKLKDEGKTVLAAVAEVIRKDAQLKTRYFQIAGHTDNIPLKGGKFGDNWGLSAMRARTVLLYLIESPEKGGGGLDAHMLHPAGYGDIDPVAKNDTADGRGQNRRVELVVLPDVEEMLDLQNMK
jgi:chemotaxis protein MotB